MIERDFIVAWRQQAPWPTDAQVEQDLVLSRALIEIFNHPLLSRELAIRGGTALHKRRLRSSFAKPVTTISVKVRLPWPSFAGISKLLIDPRTWMKAPLARLRIMESPMAPQPTSRCHVPRFCQSPFLSFQLSVVAMLTTAYLLWFLVLARRRQRIR